MKKIVSTCILAFLFTSLFAQKPYKGGEVYSKGEILYGKFEMRMKMIKGGGMLSTFYTIKHFPGGSNPYWAELDIEVLGRNNAQIMSTNLFMNNSNGNLIHSEKQIPLDFSLADDFYTYTLEWTPNYVAWFINGVEYRRKTGAFISHMNIPQGYRFNAWISSTPAWVGNIDESAMPAYQTIDWIEYSSYNAATQKFTKKWRDDFNSFNNSRWAKAQWTFPGNQVDFVKENVYIKDGTLVLAITNPNAPLNIDKETIKDSFTAKYFANNKEIVISNLKDDNYKVQVYDITGKVVFSKQVNASNFSIPCSNIQNGLYIVSIINKDKKSRQKLLIY